jgi:hypothetical protein
MEICSVRPRLGVVRVVGDVGAEQYKPVGRIREWRNDG